MPTLNTYRSTILVSNCLKRCLTEQITPKAGSETPRVQRGCAGLQKKNELTRTGQQDTTVVPSRSDPYLDQGERIASLQRKRKRHECKKKKKKSQREGVKHKTHCSADQRWIHFSLLWPFLANSAATWLVFFLRSPNTVLRDSLRIDPFDTLLSVTWPGSHGSHIACSFLPSYQPKGGAENKGGKKSPEKTTKSAIAYS